MAKTLNRKVTIYIDGKEVKSTLASLEAEMRKLKAQQKNMTIGSEEYIRTTKKIQQLNGILEVQKREVRGLGNEWKNTTTKVAEFANIATGLNSAFQMFDIGIGKIKDLAKSAAQMDDAYGKVMKTTSLTHEQVEKLNEAFKAMDTRTSREQLNQLAYEAGKLGFTGVENVQQFVEAADVINMALGDVLGEGATLEIAKLAQVFANSTEALDKLDLKGRMMAVGSAINQLGKESTASESYMVDFLGRLGGIATQAGLSADQILGYASALDQNKQKVEMSATAFQKLIQQMIKKPQEFVEAARMPLDDFRKLMDSDMNGAILRVLDGFHQMGGLIDQVPVFKDMGLDGARAAGVMASLAGSIDKVAKAQESANLHIHLGNSMTKEYNTMQNTMQARMEKSKKRFEETRIELGNELYPVLIHLQKTGTVLMKGVGGFVQLIKENKAILPGLIALLTNWVRVKTMALIASGKLQGALKAMLGLNKLEAHQMAVNTASELKLTAAKEREKLATIQNQLATERENLARQKSKVGMEAQSLVEVNATRVRQLEAAATEQATVATNANTAAIKAQKAAFASAPWGLVITALTTIAALMVNVVKNSEKWKLKETLRETARQAGEAEGKVKVLFERLQDATAGSEDYKKAVEELKAEYPDLIAKHTDEEGKIKDLTAAYNDLAAAARQSVYDRMYAEQYAKSQADLADKLRKRIEWFGNKVDQYFTDLSEAERTALKQQINTILTEAAQGETATAELVGNMRDLLLGKGMKAGHTIYSVMQGELMKMRGEAQRADHALANLKTNLKSTDTDPFGVQKMSLEELEAELNRYLDMMDHGFSEGAERDAARLKAYREQIAKLKAEQKKDTDNTPTPTVTEETEKERKAREKAEAAWQRFSQSYDQAMSKINARTLTGVEAIGAEIDNATQKMRTALSELDQTAHPEAAQMLSDLEAASEQWKRARIDEYIAKTNKELDRLARSTAKQGSGEIDKVRKATIELQQKLEGIDTTINQLTADRNVLAAKDDEKSRQQVANIDAQIARYRELRQAVVGAAFAEIEPTVKNPYEKQINNEVSLSLTRNRTKALAEVNRKIAEYSKLLEDAIAAEEEMARVASENGDEASAAAHRKKAEALKAQQQALAGVNEEAQKLAKQKALQQTLQKWADMIDDFGNKALSVFSNINSLLKNIADSRLQELEDEKAAEIKTLDEQLEQGLISEEQYNERKKDLEDRYTEEANKAAQEEWERNKAYSYSEAVIAAAVGALKIWAGEGPTAYKVAMSALLAAEAATQIAAIANQPRPYAKGGYVERDTIYRAGEAGREWVASNRLLNDPATAPMIQALEAYQRGNHRALQMDQLNMPVVMQAARELGRRSTGSSDRFTASKGDDMLKIMRDLAKYLEDPKNRQAYISRQTQTDFDKNEDFLRNRASLG